MSTLADRQAFTQVSGRSPPSDVLERPYAAGGGEGYPPPPTPPRRPPPLPMFEADSQNFASAPLAPRGFRLKFFSPAFGEDCRGIRGPSQPPPPLQPPPSPPSNTSLHPTPPSCGVPTRGREREPPREATIIAAVGPMGDPGEHSYSARRRANDSHATGISSGVFHPPAAPRATAARGSQ